MPEMIRDYIVFIVLQTNSYQSLIDSESDEEKEETQDTVIPNEKFDVPESKNTNKESIKKRKVWISLFFSLN